MIIRKATAQDIPAVTALFEDVHTAQENGQLFVGWVRGIYPTQATAEAALQRGDLFVAVEDETLVGIGVINQIQVDVYANAPWKHPAPDNEVMVLHTLCISPKALRKGYGSRFEAFYEDYALAHGCRYLRIDTNERNLSARALYRKLGYEEIDIVPCKFNGIPGVGLVLLEKKL